jgi:hypothetical protein
MLELNSKVTYDMSVESKWRVRKLLHKLISHLVCLLIGVLIVGKMLLTCESISLGACKPACWLHGSSAF